MAHNDPLPWLDQYLHRTDIFSSSEHLIEQVLRLAALCMPEELEALYETEMRNSGYFDEEAR